MHCPKCHYQTQEYDTDSMPGVCPACGIAYDKWQQGKEESNQDGSIENSEDVRVDELDNEAFITNPSKPEWYLRVYHYICFVPSDRHEGAFWLHSLLYVSFFLWGWSFIIKGIDWPTISNSFLHLPNLAFHEYGHIMFSPFGDFMTILGGSLLQVLLPLGVMFFFLYRQRDNFAGSIALWWCGQNFIDISPYIADAKVRLLPLLGKRGPEAHDWENLLNITGAINHAEIIAWGCFGFGALLMLLSNLWGVQLLYIEFCGRTRTNG